MGFLQFMGGLFCVVLTIGAGIGIMWVWEYFVVLNLTIKRLDTNISGLGWKLENIISRVTTLENPKDPHFP